MMFIVAVITTWRKSGFEVLCCAMTEKLQPGRTSQRTDGAVTDGDGDISLDGSSAAS